MPTANHHWWSCNRTHSGRIQGRTSRAADTLCRRGALQEKHPTPFRPAASVVERAIVLPGSVTEALANDAPPFVNAIAAKYLAGQPAIGPAQDDAACFFPGRDCTGLTDRPMSVLPSALMLPHLIGMVLILAEQLAGATCPVRHATLPARVGAALTLSLIHI